MILIIYKMTQLPKCITVIGTRVLIVKSALSRTSGSLFHTYCHRRQKSAETDLLRQLKSKIKFGGPITVAEYMKEVLTNPVAGYYMHRDVFGQQGDFITSPEISQMFGELIGIWGVNEWMQCGSPSRLHVVEFGPGRGTLSEDMLRVFLKFGNLPEAVSLHLVEISPTLSEMQREKLGGDLIDEEGGHYKAAANKSGQKIYWHSHLKTVPKGFSFYVAHEFFDALPIHKLQIKDGRHLEILIDIDETEDGPHHLRYVLSRTDTPVSKLLIDADSNRDHTEICPEGGSVMEDISSRIASDGGFALIADYGHSGEKSDTFRAFRKHKLWEPLEEPGSADLTADVDFSYLTKIAADKTTVHGPISQEKFLHNMGIGLRLMKLLEGATIEQRKHLITGYDMLTNPEKMGERFKFLAVLNKDRTLEYQPAGFVPPQ